MFLGVVEIIVSCFLFCVVVWVTRVRTIKKLLYVHLSMNLDFGLFPLTKCLKIDGNEEKLSSILELSSLATQTKSKSGEDVRK